MNKATVLCPTGNMCAMTNKEELPGCGSETHLIPDMTLDQLCPQALRKAIENEQINYSRGDRTVRRRTRSQFRRASLHFELAATFEDANSRTAHYRQADAHMAEAESHSVIRYSGALNASLFRLHWESLRTGASNLTLDETHQLQSGLIKLAERVGDHDTKTVRRARSRLGFHMLFSTRGTPALPANARQSGALFDSKRPASAHDLYIIDAESGRSIPHRLTSAEDPMPYSGPCVSADFETLAMQAMDEIAPGKITDAAQAGNLGFNLLCDYIEGYDQDEVTVNVLRLMGDMALEQAYNFPGLRTS